MSENVGASISRNPEGIHGLYGDNFTFTLPSMLKGKKAYKISMLRVFVRVFNIRPERSIFSKFSRNVKKVRLAGLGQLKNPVT
jgi:hypothetical protein